jgi:lipopolysaccharide biosynthesis protein
MRRLLRFSFRRGPLVVGAEGQSVRVEGPDEMASAPRVERVAILAHWSPDARISRSVAELTASLLANRYQVAIASSADASGPLEWPGERPAGITVLRRPNVGYDFGSWATALHRYPAISRAEQVLLLNDSLVGPFRTLDPFFEHFDRSGADVWGLTDTSQFGRHLQSYCLGFKRGCLAEPGLASFWRGIRAERSRDDVIWRYEIGLARVLDRERFSTDAAIRFRRVVKDGENPTIIGWRRLLDLGFPFVKRQLLRQPEVAPDGAEVRPVVESKFGLVLDEWL